MLILHSSVSPGTAQLLHLGQRGTFYVTANNSGFRNGVDEICALLRYYVVTFRSHLQGSRSLGPCIAQISTIFVFAWWHDWRCDVVRFRAAVRSLRHVTSRHGALMKPSE
jgi:hypothetical protein